MNDATIQAITEALQKWFPELNNIEQRVTDGAVLGSPLKTLYEIAYEEEGIEISIQNLDIPYHSIQYDFN